MLTGKQRAQLRGIANSLQPVVMIGKQGLTPEVTASADEVLEARELIKVSLLENAMIDIKDAAETLSGRTRSEIVSVVGRKFVLYRKSKTKDIIELKKK